MAAAQAGRDGAPGHPPEHLGVDDAPSTEQRKRRQSRTGGMGVLGMAAVGPQFGPPVTIEEAQVGVGAPADGVGDRGVQGLQLHQASQHEAGVKRVAPLQARADPVGESSVGLLRTERALDRARAILDRVLVNRGGAPAPKPQNFGSKRLLHAAAEAEVHDTCLWTSLAVATGARGNSTALVGTPETVAKAMLEYYKLGATSLLIRGYDPRPDAVQYGEELIPRVRKLVADYDAASGAG